LTIPGRRDGSNGCVLSYVSASYAFFSEQDIVQQQRYI